MIYTTLNPNVALDVQEPDAELAWAYARAARYMVMRLRMDPDVFPPGTVIVIQPKLGLGEIIRRVRREQITVEPIDKHNRYAWVSGIAGSQKEQG